MKALEGDRKAFEASQSDVAKKQEEGAASTPTDAESAESKDSVENMNEERVEGQQGEGERKEHRTSGVDGEEQNGKQPGEGEQSGDGGDKKAEGEEAKAEGDGKDEEGLEKEAAKPKEKKFRVKLSVQSLEAELRYLADDFFQRASETEMERHGNEYKSYLLYVFFYYHLLVVVVVVVVVAVDVVVCFHFIPVSF
jgi:hypothetical protein